MERKLNQEHGQALVEMCVCLVAIISVFLGLIVVAGLGISNIQTLLRAKTNAEYSSRGGTPAGNRGINIFAWDYGDTNNGGDGIPFTADDQSITASQGNAGSYYQQQFNGQENSESQISNQYTFTPASSLGDYANASNFAKNFPDLFVEAANLTSATGASDRGIFTLTTNQNFNSAAQLEALYDTFYGLFGIRLSEVNLQQMPANTVYMPVIGNTP
ncbi:MAG: hypothetical protein WC071_03005 [Victivallaceae bacterium]